MPSGGSSLGSPSEAFLSSGTIEKVDECQGLIFGWASQCVSKSGETIVDSQGDVIDVSDLESAAYEYVLESRDGGVDHIRKGVSRLVESMVFTPEKIEALGLEPDSMPCGWWVGFQIDDPDVLAMAKNAELAAFSIGGTGTRQDLASSEAEAA